VRAALIAAAVMAALAAPPARGGTPIALSERQVVTLEFDRAVAELRVTEPEVVALRSAGNRVIVTGQRAGRAAVEIAFGDGAAVVYDVTVSSSRRAAATAGAPGPGEVVLAVGEERRVQAPGADRVFLEENGVARARVEGGAVRVTALAPGSATLVVVDAAGGRTTYSIRVR
jgi:hypothetical protein